MKKALFLIFFITFIIANGADDGSYIEQKFVTGMSPVAVTVDDKENIYIADRFTMSILKYNSKGEYLYSFGIRNEKKENQNFYPTDVFYHDNKIYVLDINGRIFIFTVNGRLLIKREYKKGKMIGDLVGAKSIFVDDEYIYCTDSGNNRIQIFEKDGGLKTTFGYKGDYSGNLSYPEGIAVNGEDIVIADTGNDVLAVFGKNGIFKFELDPDNGEKEKKFSFKSPRGVAVDDEGKIYVIDSGNNRVQVYNKEYKLLYTFGENRKNKANVTGITDIWGKNGKIYIADNSKRRVKVYDKDMKLIVVIGRDIIVEIAGKAVLIIIVIICAVLLLRREKKYTGDDDRWKTEL